MNKTLFSFLLLYLFNSPLFSHPFLIYYGNKASQFELEQFDTLVLEPWNYKNVKNWKSLTYGYISIGEVENYRPWYKKVLNQGLLGEKNPNWPDSRYINLQSGKWQDLVIKDLIPKIEAKGYKGIFLDTVDSLITSKQPKSLIIDFINNIKKAHPHLKIMLNRGFEVAQKVNIDSILMESTITDYDFKNKKTRFHTYKFMLDMPANVKKYSVDYWPSDDRKTVKQIMQEAKKRGYIPLVSNVSLQNIPAHIKLKEKVFEKKTTPASGKIKRKVLAFYSSKNEENDHLNEIHMRLEVIFNYYGYFCDYFDINKPIPEQTDEYSTIAIWFKDIRLVNPLKFIKWLVKQKQKGIKIMIIGDIPYMTFKGKSYLKEVNSMLKKHFDFEIGENWNQSTRNVQIIQKNKHFDFEWKTDPMAFSEFAEFIAGKSCFPLLEIIHQKTIKSTPSFLADWGFFSQADKVFYDFQNKIKWLLNPFYIVKNVVDTDYPIPDITTLNGKRILYQHIDGDAAHSKSEVMFQQYTPRVFIDKILKKFPLKIGVSFIAAEVHEDFRGNKEIQKLVKEIFHHPLVEPASHTWNHPYSWEKGVIAFTPGEDMNNVPQGFYKMEQDGKYKINPEQEIHDSIEYLKKFSPPEKSFSIYWSGDCLPTKEHLAYVNQHNVLCFNGGDSFFDNVFNSYAWLHPASRYVDGERQIYSSNSNENLYTNLWSTSFWGFKRSIQTFKNTENPIRIKPINVYYHFYSLEKVASYRALKKVNEWLLKQKDQLCNIFPSQYIQIVKNFHNLEVFREKKGFRIKNANHLKELRMQGNRKPLPGSLNIKAFHYDKKQDVTYFTMGEKDSALLIPNPLQ
jgi:endo-alpha-1,4-polygalactosaminidase (GH114 family)